MSDATPSAQASKETTGRLKLRPIDIMLIAAIAGPVAWSMATRSPRESSPQTGFTTEVNLDPFNTIAVQADGRLRSYASHAKTFMSYISGPRAIDDQTPGFTYLDMIFRPERYIDRDIIYVKNKQVRGQILKALESHQSVDADRAKAIRKDGLFSRSLLSEPIVGALLQSLGRDLIRTSKVVDSIQQALSVARPQLLTNYLQVIAPASVDEQSEWFSVAQLESQSQAPADEAHAGVRGEAPKLPLREGLQDQLAQEWNALAFAWRNENAGEVNARVAQLAELLPTASAEAYPARSRLATESWYFRNKSMTWVWWIYALALAPLLMAVVYHWSGARRIGLVFFALAFLGHTVSLGIRWYISGRWPNTNMFEAVHTSAWLGGVVALFLEWIARRTPLRNLFVLGSAAVSMAALMAAYFLPAELDTNISNRMAALHDVWLYIHTNMIILAYALIALACIMALLLLRHRWCAAWDKRTIPAGRLLMVPIALGVFNYTAYLLLMHVVDPVHRGLTIEPLIGVVGACTGSFMLLLFELAAARRRTASDPMAERSAIGGAASMMRRARSNKPFLNEPGPSAGQVFDGATMVLMELSFITLWTGLVMGAIWADHAWGRPWGWDPKEVFALNTFFIFLILIHVRLKVRDKGFWTAVLTVLGFQVMMFNWIVVNFIITGLHSYA